MVYMIIDKDGESHIANKSETKDIMDVQNNVILEFGVSNILSLHFKGKTEVFYSRANQLLDDLYGYRSVFKVFDIILCQTKNENDDTLDKSEKLMRKHHLNNLVVDAINETMERTYETKQKKWSEAKEQTKQFLVENDLYWGDGFFDITDTDVKNITKAFKYPANFLKIQKELIDELILTPKQLSLNKG